MPVESGRVEVTAQRPTTVLFVDLVGSTEVAATIGDGRWAVLLERYQELFRRELAAAHGMEMDTAGDGLFAVFAEPADALAFACSLRVAVESLDLKLRVGIHTGTCWVAGDKCTGLDVNIGARIVAVASPDEILVSAPVRARLVDAPRGFAFHERGAVQLKGVPGRRSLYAVESEGEGFHDQDQGRSNGVPESQAGRGDRRFPDAREPREQRRLQATT